MGTNKTAAHQETLRVEYRYDAENHLIGRKVFTNGSSTASQQQAFVYENGQIVLQFDGTGNSLLASEALSHRYLWGPAVDQLLADEKVNDLYNAGYNELRWALADHLGTVRDWVNNSAGLLDHVEYDAFGRRLDTATVDAAFGWTARYRDPLTGLQYNDNRWYNPDVQRWMSEDPIGFRAGDANLSRYVENQPTMWVDPRGLAIEDHQRRGSQNGRPGTFYQKEQYDRHYIFWRKNVRFGPIEFVPDDIPGIGDLNGVGSRGLRGNYACVANGLGQTSDAVQAGVVIAAVGIPGPEDVVIAGASRLGYNLVKRGGQYVIKMGGKILKGADEAAAARKLGEALAAGGKGFGAFDDLKKFLGPAGKDRSWHHIVQQTPSNIEKFGACKIHNTDNIINLPNNVHDEITAIQRGKDLLITGSRSQTVQQWIGQFGYDKQYEFGKALTEFALTGKWPVGYKFPRK